MNNNNWTDEQEQLLITWAEKSSGYAWLHSHSVNLISASEIWQSLYRVLSLDI